MKINPPYLKFLFAVVFLFGFFHISIAQDSLDTKNPMYYKLDSKTNSYTPIGERPASVHPDSTKVFIDKSFPVSGYIFIALIVKAIFIAAFASLEKKKQIQFKKWILENREKTISNKK